MEKEAADIQVQRRAGLRAVVRDAPHKLLQPMHRPMRPLARPAGIGVVKKDRLPDSFEDIDQHMVHHAVSEIRREDLPKLGLFHHETDRTRGMVGPPFQLLTEPYEVVL